MIRGMTKNVNNLTDATFENMEYISFTEIYTGKGWLENFKARRITEKSMALLRVL